MTAINQLKAESPEVPGFWTNFLDPAMLLGLLVPGLGHLYTGRVRRALVWFLLVEGLFLAGFAILGIRFWGGGMNLGQKFFGFLPLLYIPEVGNLLSLCLAGQFFPAMPPAEVVASQTETLWAVAVNTAKLPVAGESLGFLLTALSGLVNLFAAADAWRINRCGDEKAAPGLTPALAALQSWLLPGLAQWRLGERSRGTLQFLAITGLFLLGLILSGGTATDRSQVYFWYAGMLLDGGAAIVSTLACSAIPLTTTNSTLWDLGVTTTCVAGLMNVVVIVDAYTLAEKRLKGEK